MNGHVTEEGITRDLEAMKQAGLGGFTLVNVCEGTPPGPVAYMSDAWWALFRYTVAEAERLKLEMSIGNCAGWTSSGGPWVTPDRAMQEVVWTEKQVTGPSELETILAIPEPALGIERDMARNPELNKRYYVPREQVRGYYRDIALLAFPTLKSDAGEKPLRLENWRAKAGFTKPCADYSPVLEKAPLSEIVDLQRMIDLTGRLDSDGRLKWKVPPGAWTLLRLGYQPTGRQNHPAPPGGRGLEIDKLSSAAAEFHWRNSVAKFIEAAGDRTGRTFNGVLIDSYEVGHQNWNASFAEDFARLRGYDLRKFLPSLTGRVVGDVDTTEKFLWDFRKTLGDLIARNYYGRFAELSHKSRLLLSAEPYGTYGNTDDFTVAGVPDVPLAEWWALEPKAEHVGTAKLASSATHTYGRKIADSEAFTGFPDRVFEEYPYNLKAQGDYFFCRGINRFHLHTFVHDPYQSLPGFGLGAYGSRFDPRNTWWPYAHAWFAYLARCQSVLQKGQFIADLLYFAGEDAPKVCKARTELIPTPPIGYDYDFCNREILDRLTVKHEHLQLPSGMSYRVLVLPPTRHMRLETLRKIEELVSAGATVVGDKPTRTPGLDGRDAELRTISNRLWAGGKIHSNKTLAEVLKVPPDFSFETRGFAQLEPCAYPGLGVEFIHRRIGDADIFFISNQHHQPKTIEALFRVNNGVPELWHPDSGTTEIATQFRSTADGRTAVTLNLDPAGSFFVVFRDRNSGVKAVQPTTALVSTAIALVGPWQVAFPSGNITLPRLISWPLHEDPKVRYFSGTAIYSMELDLSANQLGDGYRQCLDLGDVQVVAEVSVNGSNQGVLWKPPYVVDVTHALHPGRNRIEMRIANLWINRLIGDQQLSDDCQWLPNIGSFPKGEAIAAIPEWVKNGTPRPSKGCKTFTGWRWPHLEKKALLPSGLLGPVQLLVTHLK